MGQEVVDVHPSGGDARILAALQHDGKLTLQALAEKVAMSSSPCWRRVRRLEEEAVILGYRAVLDRRKIGLGVLAFIRIRLECNGGEGVRLFETQIGALDEVVACYSIGGDADYLLQVVARDLDAFAAFAVGTVRGLAGVREMRSMFVLQEIKPFRAFPVGLDAP